MSVLELLSEHRQRVSPMQCLVIDDNQPNRQILQRLLERAGHAAVFAESGPLGIQQLWSNPNIGLVLLDLHMPKIPGIDVLNTIRAHEPDLPVAIVSADSSPDMHAMA